MTDEYQRAMASLQAAFSEVMGLRVSGRRDAEALADYMKALRHAKETHRKYAEREERLSLLIGRAETMIQGG